MKKYLIALKYIFLRFILKRSFLVAKSHLIDGKFKCNAKDVLGRHLYKYGIHESENSRYLINHLELKDNEIAIDIGANLGWYSVLLSRNSTAGSTIYAFEPDPDNFKLLKHNSKENTCRNIQPINKAVSNRSENLKLHKYPEKNLGRHSLLPQEGTVPVDVSSVCLNEFFTTAEYPKIKFIKIDIEGFEYFALQGASSLLEHCPFVMMEFSPHLYTEDDHSSKLVKFMTDYYFTPNLLNNAKLKEISAMDLINETKQIDVFWVKKSG